MRAPFPERGPSGPCAGSGATAARPGGANPRLSGRSSPAPLSGAAGCQPCLSPAAPARAPPGRLPPACARPAPSADAGSGGPAPPAPGPGPPAAGPSPAGSTAAAARWHARSARAPRSGRAAEWQGRAKWKPAPSRCATSRCLPVPRELLAANSLPLSAVIVCVTAPLPASMAVIAAPTSCAVRRLTGCTSRYLENRSTSVTSAPRRCPPITVSASRSPTRACARASAGRSAMSARPGIRPRPAVRPTRRTRLRPPCLGCRYSRPPCRRSARTSW